MSAIKRQQHHVQLWEEAAHNHPFPEYFASLIVEREKLRRMIARRERFQELWLPLILAVLTIIACNHFLGPKS